MRKLGIAIGIIFALVIIGVLIFWATFDVNHYRGRIQAELESRLGRRVTLGNMHLSLAPPSFQVDNLSIADDPRFNDPNMFVQAAQLSVSVKLLPLLHKDIQIDSLKLQRPTVELIKDKQGVWNFSSLGTNPTAQPSQPRSAAKFSLSELSVQDGQVAVADQQAGHPRALYNHIDATLNDFAPDRPFSVQIATHLPGAGNQEVRLQGQGGPLAPADPAATPFHGTLSLKDVALAGLSQFLNNPALNNTDGILTGETKISSDSGKLAAEGGLTIDKARVHGLDIGYPISTQYNLADDLKTDLLNITSATLKLGQAPIAVNGTVNMKPTPMGVNLDLKADNVSIAEAGRLASAFGVAFAPGTTVNGQASANIHATGAADKPAMNGTFSARNVQITGKDVPQPVQIPSANFQLTPSQVRSDNFNIISDKTTVIANLAVSQYTAKNPILAASLQAPNAQLPSILAIAKAWGVTGLDKISGLGILNLNMHLTGPVNSLTSNDVMRALNGNMNLNFNNVRYTGVDISHQLAVIAGFLKPGNPGQNDQGFSNISHMTGDVIVNNGVAQTNNLQALLDIATVGITGTANLVTQTLNLRLNAVMSKNVSQQVGGTGIGGYLNTALANNQGELVIPVIVTGTFQSPRFQPDLQSVAQMRINGLLPTSANPQSGVAGLIGGLLGKKNQNQAQQPQQQAQPEDQPQNQVQQILGGIFGQKKKKKPDQTNPPQ